MLFKTRSKGFQEVEIESVIYGGTKKVIRQISRESKIGIGYLIVGLLVSFLAKSFEQYQSNQKAQDSRAASEQVLSNLTEGVRLSKKQLADIDRVITRFDTISADVVFELPRTNEVLGRLLSKIETFKNTNQPQSTNVVWRLTTFTEHRKAILSNSTNTLPLNGKLDKLDLFRATAAALAKEENILITNTQMAFELKTVYTNGFPLISLAEDELNCLEALNKLGVSLTFYRRGLNVDTPDHLPEPDLALFSRSPPARVVVTLDSRKAHLYVVCRAWPRKAWGMNGELGSAHDLGGAKVFIGLEAFGKIQELSLNCVATKFHLGDYSIDVNDFVSVAGLPGSRFQGYIPGEQLILRGNRERYGTESVWSWINQIAASHNE